MFTAESNIKMNLKEIVCEVVDWIQLAFVKWPEYPQIFTV
jgi:hypothetical protein